VLRVLLALAPMLLRKKRSWIAILLLGGFYVWQGGGLSALGIPGLGGGGSLTGGGLSMPDMSISRLWKEPRDLLVDRVEDARDTQTETVEEFKTALEKFKEVTNFQGGDLEKKYNTLNAAFEDSEKAAAKIDDRIDKVTSAANTLLTEWKEELNQYHDASLRSRAERQFDDTRRRADQLIAAMRNAQTRTEPVLAAFRDQVLYIKHNLNMQAIASLDEEAENIESDVSQLIKEMETSIAEANAFIDQLLKDGQG